MITILDKQDCCGCGACEQVCPKRCITMKPDEEGFLYPKVCADNCINCGLCRKVCPILSAAERENRYPQAVYAAFAKDEQVRKNSSSGGIFTLLAEWVLEQGGVVFGAGFDDDFSVHHLKIETADQLHLLRGSKYLQSRIEDTYLEAETELEQGRKVLFSGTGCQVAGLKCFLRKEYNNLLAVDILCHGVPSVKVWKRHISVLGNQFSDNLRCVSFRDKKDGWKRYASHYVFEKGNDMYISHSKDPYNRLFLSDICLRPSCHACKFREGRAGADITLGDAWGIEKWMPEMDDDRGTSVVLVNTEKGQVVWEAIGTRMSSKPADAQKALACNTVFYKSVKPHPNRKRFFTALNQDSEMGELLQLLRKPMWRRVLSFGKRHIKRLLGV